MAIVWSIDPDAAVATAGRVSSFDLNGNPLVGASVGLADLGAHKVIVLDNMAVDGLMKTTGPMNWPARGAIEVVMAVPAALAALANSNPFGIFSDCDYGFFANLQGSPAGLTGQIWGGPEMISATGSVVNDGLWHVWLFSWDTAVGVSVYRDGIEVATTDLAFAPWPTLAPLALPAWSGSVLDATWVARIAMNDALITDKVAHAAALLAEYGSLASPTPSVPYVATVAWTESWMNALATQKYLVRYSAKDAAGRIVVVQTVDPDPVTGVLPTSIELTGVMGIVQVIAVNVMGQSVPAEILL